MESGIAGKDNENGTAGRKGEEEGGRMGTWTCIHCCNPNPASLIKASTAVS